MVALNEDVVSEIVEQLAVLHANSWTSEFRPEANRRFFISYALVSRVWVLPAERIIYRYSNLIWASQTASFESGVMNRVRGQALREAIRVLDISVTNSHLGNGLAKLDKLLHYCPHLVELRLHIGAEVNTLFLRPSQETKLRHSFRALHPTLRALQLKIDSPWTKTKIVRQIQELVPFSGLDFLSIVSNSYQLELPQLDPAHWDIRSSSNERTHWPLETNAATVPLRDILYPPETAAPFIAPETLRQYTPDLVGMTWDHPFLELLGPRLKQVMSQLSFSGSWTHDCNKLVSICPSIERIIALDFHPNRQHSELPNSHMYILERQDWHTTVPFPDEEEKEEAEQGEEDGEAKPKPGDVIICPVGDPVPSLSHVVAFHRNVSHKWLKDHQEHTFRKKPKVVYDSRWPNEAFTGIESGRTGKEVFNTYRWEWSQELITVYPTFFIALRQPSTEIPPSP